MKFTREISSKIRTAIKVKLAEIGNDVYEELPDYIMVMVANKKSEEQMTEDLTLFLGDNTERFTSWLCGLLSKLQSLTQDQAMDRQESANTMTGESPESDYSNQDEDASCATQEGSDETSAGYTKSNPPEEMCSAEGGNGDTADNTSTSPNRSPTPPSPSDDIAANNKSVMLPMGETEIEVSQDKTGGMVVEAGNASGKDGCVVSSHSSGSETPEHCTSLAGVVDNGGDKSDNNAQSQTELSVANDKPEMMQTEDDVITVKPEELGQGIDEALGVCVDSGEKEGCAGSSSPNSHEHRIRKRSESHADASDSVEEGEIDTDSEEEGEIDNDSFKKSSSKQESEKSVTETRSITVRTHTVQSESVSDKGIEAVSSSSSSSKSRNYRKRSLSPVDGSEPDNVVDLEKIVSKQETHKVVTLTETRVIQKPVTETRVIKVKTHKKHTDDVSSGKDRGKIPSSASSGKSSKQFNPVNVADGGDFSKKSAVKRKVEDEAETRVVKACKAETDNMVAKEGGIDSPNLGSSKSSNAKHCVRASGDGLDLGGDSVSKRKSSNSESEARVIKVKTHKERADASGKDRGRVSSSARESTKLPVDALGVKKADRSSLPDSDRIPKEKCKSEGLEEARVIQMKTPKESSGKARDKDRSSVSRDDNPSKRMKRSASPSGAANDVGGLKLKDKHKKAESETRVIKVKPPGHKEWTGKDSEAVSSSSNASTTSQSAKRSASPAAVSRVVSAGPAAVSRVVCALELKDVHQKPDVETRVIKVKPHRESVPADKDRVRETVSSSANASKSSSSSKRGKSPVDTSSSSVKLDVLLSGSTSSHQSMKTEIRVIKIKSRKESGDCVSSKDDRLSSTGSSSRKDSASKPTKNSASPVSVPSNVTKDRGLNKPKEKPETESRVIKVKSHKESGDHASSKDSRLSGVSSSSGKDTASKITRRSASPIGVPSDVTKERSLSKPKEERKADRESRVIKVKTYKDAVGYTSDRDKVKTHKDAAGYASDRDKVKTHKDAPGYASDRDKAKTHKDVAGYASDRDKVKTHKDAAGYASDRDKVKTHKDIAGYVSDRDRGAVSSSATSGKSTKHSAGTVRSSDNNDRIGSLKLIQSKSKEEKREAETRTIKVKEHKVSTDNVRDRVSVSSSSASSGKSVERSASPVRRSTSKDVDRIGSLKLNKHKPQEEKRETENRVKIKSHKVAAEIASGKNSGTVSSSSSTKSSKSSKHSTNPISATMDTETFDWRTVKVKIEKPDTYSETRLVKVKTHGVGTDGVGDKNSGTHSSSKEKSREHKHKDKRERKEGRSHEKSHRHKSDSKNKHGVEVKVSSSEQQKERVKIEDSQQSRDRELSSPEASDDQAKSKIIRLELL